MIPTRKRPQHLARAVASLADRASTGEPIEYLLRVDDDDSTDYEPYRRLQAKGENFTVIGGPRHGYKQMHLYYNELAAAARGEWLVVWNDDMDMLTEGWDEKLLSRRDELLVMFLRRDISETCDTAYPAFPKRLFELLGHVSMNCHCDSWLDVVSEKAGIRIFREDIVLHHHRLEDETASEIQYDWEAFNGSADLGAIRGEDVRRIQEALKGAT